MKRMNLFEAGAMQKEIEEKFGEHIHIHDQCGTDLWFSLDEENDEIRAYIKEFVEAKGHTLKVSEDGLQFTVS